MKSPNDLPSLEVPPCVGNGNTLLQGQAFRHRASRSGGHHKAQKLQFSLQLPLRIARDSLFESCPKPPT